jgi:predicted transcriptional regulator
MDKKLFDSELRLMELLWENEPVSAKELSLIAAEKIGWNKNTTYTVIKKLVAKGAVKRDEPNFVCTSLVKPEEIRRQETESLINRMFKGSRKALFAALIDDDLSENDIRELKEMLNRR